MSTIRTDRRTPRPLATLLTLLLLLTTLALPALAHGDHRQDTEATRHGHAVGRTAPAIGAELARVRAATARFHDVEVAMDAGYATVSPCVEDPGGAGAVGIHYLNPTLIGWLDRMFPQALLYLPASDGRLRLVGVEYLSPFDPGAPGAEPGQLFGQRFEDETPLGPSTGLHVWLWQANPAGMFAAYNPNLSCPAGS